MNRPDVTVQHAPHCTHPLLQSSSHSTATTMATTPAATSTNPLTVYISGSSEGKNVDEGEGKDEGEGEGEDEGEGEGEGE